MKFLNLFKNAIKTVLLSWLVCLYIDLMKMAFRQMKEGALIIFDLIKRNICKQDKEDEE